MNLTLKTRPAPSNPDMNDQSWDADHWHCEIASGDHPPLQFHYSKGKGLNGEKPTLDELMVCLSSDLRIHENEEYDDFGITVKQAMSCIRHAEKIQAWLELSCIDAEELHAEAERIESD